MMSALQDSFVERQDVGAKVTQLWCGGSFVIEFVDGPELVHDPDEMPRMSDRIAWKLQTDDTIDPLTVGLAEIESLAEVHQTSHARLRLELEGKPHEFDMMTGGSQSRNQTILVIDRTSSHEGCLVGRDDDVHLAVGSGSRFHCNQGEILRTIEMAVDTVSQRGIGGDASALGVGMQAAPLNVGEAMIADEKS